MDADNHTLVNLIVGRHKHPPAVFQIPQRISHRLALLLRHQHAVMATRHIGFHRRIVVKHMAHQARAARQRHKFALETNQAARGNVVFQAGAPVAIAFHIGELATAATEFFHHRALVFIGYVHGQILIRLAFLPVNLTEHHARLAHRQFKALAAHIFQQNGQMQFAAP